MSFTWQWIINQILAFIGLIFVVLSFQQKTSLKLILMRNIATFFVFTGLCFLGNISAIIMCGAGVLRNIVALYYAINPDTKKTKKYISSILIVILLIILNIIFWNNLLNLYSIVLGAFNVYTFMQEKPSTIRLCSVFAEILAIIYYVLLFTPVNIVIDSIGLISAIIGIIRLDIKRPIK